MDRWTKQADLSGNRKPFEQFALVKVVPRIDDLGLDIADSRRPSVSWQEYCLGCL